LKELIFNKTNCIRDEKMKTWLLLHTFMDPYYGKKDQIDQSSKESKDVTLVLIKTKRKNKTSILIT